MVTNFVTETVVDIIHIIPGLLHDQPDNLCAKTLPSICIQQTWISACFPKGKSERVLSSRQVIQAIENWVLTQWQRLRVRA